MKRIRFGLGNYPALDRWRFWHLCYLQRQRKLEELWNETRNLEVKIR